MGTVVEVAENNGGMFEEGVVQTTSSSLASTKQIGNPVVYKLVRVEGDGRLVPATDEEIMEVKDLLENNKSDIHIVPDTGQIVECISDEGFSSGLPQLESSEGVSQSDNSEPEAVKLDSRLEYIDEMLQKVKQEEKLHVTYESRTHSPYVNVDSPDQNDELPDGEDKLQSEAPLQESLPSSLRSLNECHTNQPMKVGECSNPSDGPKEAATSIPTVTSSSKPDFSKLKGEICLDNLSIKELQETFRATFGRETTVKDKQWLKRRIAMGLTNSCDIPMTTLIIKDNRLIKGNEENCTDVRSASAKDTINEASVDSCKESPTGLFNQMNGHQSADNSPSDNFGDYSCGSGDFDVEHRASKRVRKPTRRYIEELSETEAKHHGGMPVSSSKDQRFGQLSPKFQVRSVRSFSSGERIVVTKMVPLAGSRIQVPCVSQVRRSRPRENVMALMEFHPSCMGTKATPSKSSQCFDPSQLNSGNGDGILTIKSTPKMIQQDFVALQPQFVAEPPNNKQCSAIDPIEAGHNMGLMHVDSRRNSSDDNLVSLPTPNGGFRRKHHRAWTLSEVLKLVEGVAKYGAGRWSEIKRLCFASYSYRTSVDLKDKWRNLLKASFAQTPSDKGANFRKHGSMLIPTAILRRVRELAEKQAEAPPNASTE